MCLSIPARVDKIANGMATCSVGKSSYETSLDLITDENISVGDYVLIHTGFAIQKLDVEEAKKILDTFEEFKELNNELDLEEKTQNKRII